MRLALPDSGGVFIMEVAEDSPLHGKIVPGEQIVLALTASAHRASAFAACDFLMDYLKTRAPFWKKQHRRDGTSDEWVAARKLDDAAAQRWVLPS